MVELNCTFRVYFDKMLDFTTYIHNKIYVHTSNIIYSMLKVFYHSVSLRYWWVLWVERWLRVYMYQCPWELQLCLWTRVSFDARWTHMPRWVLDIQALPNKSLRDWLLNWKVIPHGQGVRRVTCLSLDACFWRDVILHFYTSLTPFIDRKSKTPTSRLTELHIISSWLNKHMIFERYARTRISFGCSVHMTIPYRHQRNGVKMLN